MKRLRNNKYALLAGALLLTAVTLIGWQAAQADWVRRISHRAGISLVKAQPAPTVARAKTQESKQQASPPAAFERVADLSRDEGAPASEPVASLTTDLNEDGQLDLVTAFDTSLVTVRSGTADGSFRPATSFSIDAQIDALAAGDVTGDGHVDLLVADGVAQSLLVLVGDGHGGLPRAQRVPLAGTPSSLVVKNFLGGQRAEVLLAVSTGAHTELLLWQDVAWLRPMAKTALQATQPRTLALTPTRLTTPLPGVPSRVDVGYADSDSSADIIMVGKQQISVLFGDRTAPFQRMATVALEQPPLASAIADFNGDTRADVALLDSVSHDVIVYAINAAGQWGVRERRAVGLAATALTAADINGDRVEDLVVVRPEAKQVAVFLGGRKGHLGGELMNDVDGNPLMAVPAYLDNDELADLIVLKQHGVSLLYTKESATPLAQGGVGDSPIVAIDPLELNVQVPEGECRTVPVTITIAPTSFRPLDIYLLVDSSQSFNDNINNFMRDSQQFVQALLDLRGDIRLGVGTFRDYPIRPFGTLLDTAYRRVTDLKQVNLANRRQLIDAIKSIRTGGGGDDPEAQLPALFQAATGAGQDVPGFFGRADIAPDQQASFRRNVDVEKIVVLITDSNFHDAGDPGSIPYPGPSFADTIAELNARGIKVIGVASGGPGGDASITVNALRQIAEATRTRARRDIDCDGDGIVDIGQGDPIVCPPPTDGVNLKDVILSVVRGFDLPVPLTLEFDRDCSPISTTFDPPVQFVNPLTGGTFTFNLTFCCPFPSAPTECRFETKVILDEIIRARIPSRVECIRPTCDVSPPSLDFGDVCLGDTSAPQTITVNNTGNGPFTVNDILSDNPAFSVAGTSSPLPATVGPGESLTVSVGFTCTTPGPQSGTISFVTDPAIDLIGEQRLCRSVPVSGFCTNIDGEVAPAAIDFGNVCVGDSATRTLTVSNTGNQPFSVDAVNSSNPAFTVAPAGGVTIFPGGSTTFTVTFTCTPAEVGPQTGTISFTTSNGDNCPFDLGTVDVSGTCLLITCDLAPRTIDFGEVCVGDSADQTFTVNNTGNGDFTINGISSSNPAFSIVSPALPVTVPSGGSTPVTVRFTCTTPGAQSGTISFVTDSACGPVDCGEVDVSGTCLLITGDVNPGAIDFGDVCVGSSADRTFTVSNTGNGPFTITAINSSSAEFSIVSPATPVTLNPGDAVTVTVRLTCTTPGPQSGTISFASDSACGPPALGTVSLTGFCALITCDVAPRTIDFGNVFVGDNADRTFTVNNTGNRPFTIDGISSNNPAFTIVSPTLPATVPAGGSVPVTVRLTCTSAGPESGTISFATSSACGPIDCGVVNVSGLCAVLSCGTAPAVIDFGSVPVGSSADATATATNTGNVPFTVTAVNTAAPFSVVGTSPALPATLNPGQSLSVTVRLTCASPTPVGGQESGQLVFVTDPNANCPPVGLRGFCEQLACAVSPATLDFGEVDAGMSRNRIVSLSNAGNVPFTLNAISSSNPFFTIAATSAPLPASIPPGATITATILFTCPPDASGVQSGAISFSSTPASLCPDVPVTGECVLGAICAVDPASINLGRIIVNTAQRTGELNPNDSFTVPGLTISNMGDRDLVISDFVSSNPRCRVVTPLPLTVPAGSSATVVVECEARELGPQTSTITFTSNARNAAQCTVDLQFEGIFGPRCIFSSPPGTPPNFNFDTSFPDVTVGDSTTINGLVQLFNLGDLDLIVNKDGRRPVSTNVSFEVISMAGTPLPPSGSVPEITIAPGDFIEVQIRFTGVDVGPQQGAIRFFTNERIPDPNSPPCVLKNVNGNVVLPPACTLSTDNITLNAFAACSSDQETVTLSNTGGQALVISDIQNANPEIEVLDASTGTPPVLPLTVPAGASVQFLIRCTPLTTGTQTTTIRFISNDPNPNACALRVTCVSTGGPICQVVMPDTGAQPTGGAPDGKTFGQVVIAPPGNPLFGTVITDPTGVNPPVFVGRKVLPIVVRNVGDAPLVLGRDRNGNPTPNVVTLTNTNYRVEGFNFDDVIPPGGEQAGTVIFEPSLRQLQVTTIRFFTNTCVGECVLTGVNGVGIAQAQCQLPLSLNVGTATVGSSVEASFLLVNRGDRALVVSDPAQIVSDNPTFTVTTPLPITVPPEFQGGESGVLITVRFTPTAAGEQIGRITFNFNNTQLTQVFPGTPAACTINVSGTGTTSLSGVSSQQAVEATGVNRPAR